MGTNNHSGTERGMTVRGRTPAELATTAARCTTIEALAEATLNYLDALGAIPAGLWSRVGPSGWHRVASRGAVPEDPPADAADWTLLRVTFGERTTVLGLAHAHPDPDLDLGTALGPGDLALLEALLEGGLRRLEAEAITETALQAGDQRLATILDATPDAVVVVGLDGEVLHANCRAVELFGHPLEDLVGGQLERLLPAQLRARHRQHRDAYATAPSSRSMAAGQDLHALRADGTEVPVDVALEPLEVDGRTVVAAFVRDASARRRAEEHRQRLAAADLARRHALELNDNVVQGLTSAVWLLEVGEHATGLMAARQTLEAARSMMKDLVGETHADLEPGMLRRAASAPTSGAGAAARAPVTTTADSGVRVVIADDSEDLRMLLKMRLRAAGIHPVADAADGRRAVQAVEQHLPDVVIMDLSMPVLDGLEATALLRRRYPQLGIVVLSGHPREAVLDQALAAGADAYVQKGGSFDEIIAAVRTQAGRRQA